ncbi:MAG: hypothetical protein NC405_06880 [Odoribacter sp.]|nr:hypothetical protein [Odoribacter sp.]
MKKTLLSICLLCGSLICSAQLVEVQKVEKVAMPEGHAVSMAALSPDGSYAVVSPISGQGLATLDLSTGSTKIISYEASPVMVQFSADGSHVIYRESSYDGAHRRFVALKSYDVKSTRNTTLVAPSRNLQGFSVEGNTAVAVENGRAKARSVSGSAVTATTLRPTLSIDHGQLCITTAGTTKVLSPLGIKANSYLWPSLSPDGSRIAFFAVGCGAFTCDLNGNDVKPLGMLRAVCWLDNNILVGMDDHDNGIVTTKSALVAVSADGAATQTLTDDAVVAIFPSAGGSRISFTTPAGDLYLIDYTIKK